MDSEWHLVDRQLVTELGLGQKQCAVIWFLLDSLVIKTDTTKTSSIVLGELFDIGLRFMDCLGKHRTIHDLTVVTDMVRIFRIDRENDYSLQIRKHRDYLPHRVYLSNTAALTTAIINYHSKINYGSNPCMIATVDPRPNLPVDFDYDFTGKMDTIGRIVRRKDFGVCSVEGAVRMVMLFVSVT